MQSSVRAPAAGRALAVDIGGTKLAAGLVDARGSIVFSTRAATPKSRDPEEVWAALATIVDAAMAHGKADVCGVGCGGPMEEKGEYVSPLNIRSWRGFPLRQRIRDRTNLETWVDNDAKAFALAEGWVGGASGMGSYLSMVVSTGVGAGIVLDGRLLDGESGNAGHIGHLIVEPQGRVCECGGRGCLEAEASGTAIAAITGRPPAEATGEVVERTGRLVGQAVASVANLLDLQLATVAGSVAFGFGAPFFDAAQREISERCRLAFSAPCRIVSSVLGSGGPLIGAAAVGWRGLAEA